MWKRIILILTIIGIHLTLPLCVMADTSVQISVTATPAVTGGISDFTIVYISETQLDLSWSLTGNATAIMVRAKYGDYPDNIPDKYTEPSDGYLVYSGNGTSISDTSMDFDANPGPLYYAAWAQNIDGTWYTDRSTGEKESIVVTLLGILGFSGLMSFLALRSTYFGLKLMAGMSWFAFFMYFKDNPPSVITEGSGVHTAILVVAIGFGLMVVLSGLQRGIKRTNNYDNFYVTSEESGFHLPAWMRGMTGGQNTYQARRERRDRQLENYEDRWDRALGTGRYRRRR